MRNMQFLIFVICFFDVSTASPLKIGLSRNSTESFAEIRVKDVCKRLMPNKTVKIAGVIINYTGDSFLITSKSRQITDVEFYSRDLPLLFSAFSSERCKISAPDVSILEETYIDDFSAEILGTVGVSSGQLSIEGQLRTQLACIKGSVKVDGILEVKDDGMLLLEKMGCGSLTVNGAVFAQQQLHVGIESPNAQVINNGIIQAEHIDIAADKIINHENARVASNTAIFQVGNFLKNNGSINVRERMDITLPQMLASMVSFDNPVNFLQMGLFEVTEAVLCCNLESFGRTRINRAVFPTNSHLKINAGKTIFGSVEGCLHLIQANKGAKAVIGETKVTNDPNLNQRLFIKSVQSELQMGSVASNVDSVFSAQSGGFLSIEKVNAPGNFAYSSGATLNFGTAKGKSKALITKHSRFSTSDAKIETLITDGQSKADVSNSSVGHSYILDQSQGQFSNTRISKLTNRGNSMVADSNIKSTNNKGEITIVGDTQTDQMNNEGISTYKNGKHKIKRYQGQPGSTIKVQDTLALTDQRTEFQNCKTGFVGMLQEYEEQRNRKTAGNNNTAAILAERDTLVSIDHLDGTGAALAAKQRYKGEKLPKYYMSGQAITAEMEHMPLPSELPQYEGTFGIFANVHHDIINRKDLDYGDAIVVANMNGHKIKNRDATVRMEGLAVINASEFSNDNGVIGVQKGLFIDADRVSNTAQPVIGRKERAVELGPLHCELSSLYSSRNPKTGIVVSDGSFEVQCQDFQNRFSTIACGEELYVDAQKTFRNTAGNVVTSGKGTSEIRTKQIVNESLPTTKRYAESHAEVDGWKMSMWVRDEVAQSPGAEMKFGGNLNVKGSVYNDGSKISVKGHCDVRGNEYKSRKIAENKADFNCNSLSFNGKQMSLKKTSIAALGKNRHSLKDYRKNKK